MSNASNASLIPLLESDPWVWWRDQMPVTERWAYFDHAAVAPLPAPTAARMGQLAGQVAAEGDVSWLDFASELDRLRDGIASWIDADAEEIALIPNTSYGINLVAEGIRWQPGDNVVLPAGEFPSNLFPWLQQESEGVEVRIVGAAGTPPDLEAIGNAIDDRTRVVAASWVGYASGYRIDVDQLCQLAHSRGALVFLDAIQGVGPFPISVRETPVDFLAADGHKWMLGPEGAGFAYLRKDHLNQLRCRTVGWNSVKNAHLFSGASFDLKPTAARFESGTYNMAGLLALHQSLQIFWQVAARHGRDAIARRVLSLVSEAQRQLTAAGAESFLPAEESHRSGIVSFSVPGVEPAEFRKQALAAGVVVSCRGRGVRASLHAYNDGEEIERLAACVREALRDAESTSHA